MSSFTQTRTSPPKTGDRDVKLARLCARTRVRGSCNFTSTREMSIHVHTRLETQVQLHTNAHIATKAQRQARDLAPIICHYAVVRDAASKRARGAAHRHAHRFIQALRQTHNTHN